MKKILSDKNELNHRIFDIPLSAVTYNGKKINYFKFLSEGEFSDCNKALKRIASRIDMKKIYEILEQGVEDILEESEAEGEAEK